MQIPKGLYLVRRSPNPCSSVAHGPRRLRGDPAAPIMMSMTVEREDILEFMGSPSYRPLRRRELARAMGLAGRDYDDFCHELGELEYEGAVYLARGRRYALPRNEKRVDGVPGTFISKGAFGFVRPDDGEGDFYIGGAHLGGAMDGDRVLVAPRRGRGPRRSGRIVKVTDRRAEEVVGILRTGPGGPYLLPGERPSADPVEIVPGEGLRDADLPVGHKVAARLTRYPTQSRPAVAEVVEDLGAAGTLEAETAAVIRELGLRERHPQEALDEAEGLPDALPAEELERRVDYRAQGCFTIDPADAADHDDAVFLERIPEGWRLYVHIADVSWYVRPGSALDGEARERSTSVYLPGRVLPMLPRRISSNLCSLRPGEVRAAQTAVIDFTEAGERRGYRLQRSVIRSAHRLNYAQVRRLLDGGPEPGDEVPETALEMLRRMRDFSQTLRARRFAAGSIFLDLPEIRVRVDAEGRTVAVERRSQDFSHQLVEEFMLAANRAVAEHLVAVELPGIYRIHEVPDEEKLRELAEYLKSHKLNLKPPYTRGKLQHVIESVRGKPCEQAVCFATLTSLKQARYSGMPGEHYALAFEPYCHFTSPIRRYPDLVVHRQLAGLYPASSAEVPGHGPGGRRKGSRAAVDDRRRSGSRMESAATHASIMERRADEAERRLTRFRQLDLLKRSAVGEIGGVITSVVEFGMFVRLDEFLVDGLVHVTSMNDRYNYLRHRQELVGLRTGRRWRAGERVDVRIVRVEPATGRLELELG